MDIVSLFLVFTENHLLGMIFSKPPCSIPPEIQKYFCQSVENKNDSGVNIDKVTLT